MENNNYQGLIQKIMDCVLACEHCATACLAEPEVQKMVPCIKLDRDCADICTLAARLLQRNSVIARQYLLLCEEICRLCGDECARHETEHCQKCAEACHTCAEACHAHHTPITQD